MLKLGDQIGLIACSDGRAPERRNKIEAVKQVFINWGLKPIEAKTIYRKKDDYWSGQPEERAQALMSLYLNREIKAIFDLSGGDSANQVLPYLDFNLIKQSIKPFFGYSDLTVILNSLFSQADHSSYLYQVMHLVGQDSLNQQEELYQLLFKQLPKINFDYRWIYGDKMSGTMIGGNIRCLLKLAGTKYLPDPKGKLLFLESRSGSQNRIATYFAQLDQIGYFAQIKGLFLGQFTELEQKDKRDKLFDLIRPFQDRYQFPIIKTDQIGHSSDSRLLKLGSNYVF